MQDRFPIHRNIARGTSRQRYHSLIKKGPLQIKGSECSHPLSFFHTSKYRPRKIDTAIAFRSQKKAAVFERYFKTHTPSPHPGRLRHRQRRVTLPEADKHLPLQGGRNFRLSESLLIVIFPFFFSSMNPERPYSLRTMRKTASRSYAFGCPTKKRASKHPARMIS